MGWSVRKTKEIHYTRFHPRHKTFSPNSFFRRVAKEFFYFPCHFVGEEALKEKNIQYIIATLYNIYKLIFSLSLNNIERLLSFFFLSFISACISYLLFSFPPSAFCPTFPKKTHHRHPADLTDFLHERKVKRNKKSQDSATFFTTTREMINKTSSQDRSKAEPKAVNVSSKQYGLSSQNKEKKQVGSLFHTYRL